MKTEKLLADYLVGVTYEEIPASVVAATKGQILNIICAILGGGAAGGMKELVELLRHWGGRRESTIIGWGDKVPAPHAAQANASMGHALDFDDTYNKVMLHPGVVSVPPALAVAEMKHGVSGKEFITAITLAVDMGCRMCLVMNTPTKKKEAPGWQSWHFTALFGYFMAAAAAGRLLRLDEEKILNALGLAYHQAAGNMQGTRTAGTHAKRLGPGFSSRAGVVSALMAQKGISGAKDFIEGEVGFYPLYHPQCSCNLDRLIDNLGQDFENEDISLKPYPCGVVNHTAIDAALAITREQDLKPDDVAQITIFTGQGSHFLCQPLESRRHPNNAVETQFSMPWSVATAIAKRRSAIWDYTEEAARDQALHELTSKIDAEIDPKLTGGTIEPTRVSIKTTDGKEFTKQVDFPLGSPQKPFSRVDFKRKLSECNSVSIRPIPDEKLENLVNMMDKLEDLEDIGDLMRVLV